MFHRHKFHRGPWQEHRFQKGDLKYVVLDLINEKPRYGYEIIRALEERSHGFYTPSPGAIYPTLQMLQDKGHVTSEKRDGKKVYTITDEGRSFLAERGDIAAGVKSQMEDWWSPDHIREMGKIWGEIGRLSGLVAGQTRGASSGKMTKIRSVITDAHAAIEAILRD